MTTSRARSQRQLTVKSHRHIEDCALYSESRNSTLIKVASKHIREDFYGLFLIIREETIKTAQDLAYVDIYRRKEREGNALYIYIYKDVIIEERAIEK